MPRRISTGGSGANVADLSFQGNVIRPTKADANLVFDPNGTGITTTNNAFTITDNTAATSSSSGSLVVSGGIGVGGDVYVGGTINIGSGGGINGTALNGTLADFTTLTTEGNFTVSEYTETMPAKTGATGTVVHDFTEGNNWYHSAIASNFTANFTNLPTTNNRKYTFTLYLLQGGTPYLANGLQIDNVPQTIRWAAYGAPTANANRFEALQFVCYRVSSQWTVFGSLQSHG